jgi:hypothetical protein
MKHSGAFFTSFSRIVREQVVLWPPLLRKDVFDGKIVKFRNKFLL